MSPERVAEGRRRISASERSELLLDVAERLFIEKGFDRTSIGDIALAGGVTRPMVYEYHGSKEGVYLASLERAKRRIAADYAAALAGLQEPRVILRTAADVFFSMVEQDPERWVLLYGGRVPLAGEFGARQQEIQASNASGYVDTIGRWARSDVSPEQIAQAVNMIWGAAGALAEWWLTNRHVTREQVVESYTDFCWNALTPLLAERHRG